MNVKSASPPGNFEEIQLSADGNSQSSHPQTTRKIQLLRIGPLVFGVFEDEISTIEEWRQPTPLPHAPSAVLGVVAIQGRILTTLNPVALIGETTENDNSALRRIAALRGSEQVALAFEDEGAVVELAVKEIPKSKGPAGGVVLGTFRNKDQMVNLLDVRNLFPAAIKGSERRRRRV